ncbi:hypothetical protein BJY52DRAFT_1080305, partial [Lactarius psammicola]
YKRGQSDIIHVVDYSGNNNKSHHESMDASPIMLRTRYYINVLYVHWWVHTSVEEVIYLLRVLVQQGKILYRIHYPLMLLFSGISNTSAWAVSKANRTPMIMAKTPFSVYQGNWSVLDLLFER